MPVIATSAAASARGWGMFGIRSPGYRLFAWGYNNQGQVGDLSVTTRSSPVQIGSNRWLTVSAGSFHSIGITTAGTLWTWGANDFGQLGDGTTLPKSSPVQLGSASNWTDVHAGYGACWAVKSDGTLWAWGYNGTGLLGDGTTINKSSPVQIGALTNWGSGKMAANRSMFFVKNDGTLWAWGGNVFGQLGDGTAVNKSSPVQIGALTDWVAAAVTRYSCVAARANGTLWAWGYNGVGQLGDGTTVNKSSPVQIGALTDWSGRVTGGGLIGPNAGQRASVVKANGTLWSWGGNALGRLGDGTTVNKSSPVQVGALTDWLSSKLNGIAAGDAATLAIKADGTLWAWGSGSYGMNGLGNVTNYSSPVQVGAQSNWSSVSAPGRHVLALVK